jgi:peptide/nickel transport system permease protein
VGRRGGDRLGVAAVPSHVLGATAVGAALIAIATFLFDLFLTWLDPRVRAREAAS